MTLYRWYHCMSRPNSPVSPNFAAWWWAVFNWKSNRRHINSLLDPAASYRFNVSSSLMFYSERHLESLCLLWIPATACCILFFLTHVFFHYIFSPEHQPHIHTDTHKLFGLSCVTSCLNSYLPVCISVCPPVIVALLPLLLVKETQWYFLAKKLSFCEQEPFWGWGALLTFLLFQPFYVLHFNKFIF